MISGFRDTKNGVTIMVGLSMLLGAIVLVTILVLVEITVFLWREKPPPEMLTRITTSPNLNLVLYELVAVLIIIGLPLFIEESQNLFLTEVFPTVMWRMVIGLIMMVGMLLINVVRYGRLGLDMRYVMRIYNVAASNAEDNDVPEVGLEEATAFVNESKSNYPKATEQGFLEYLSTRNDELGALAREKLS